MFIFVLILLVSLTAIIHGNESKLSRNIEDFKYGIQARNISPWAPDMDILITGIHGGVPEWDSVAFGLLDRGELELTLGELVYAIRSAGEAGLARAMVSVLTGYTGQYESVNYEIALLREWVLEAKTTGLLEGIIPSLSLELMNYIMDISKPFDNRWDDVDTDVFELYSSFYSDITIGQWISLLVSHGIEGVFAQLSSYWDEVDLEPKQAYEYHYFENMIMSGILDWFTEHVNELERELPTLIEEGENELKHVNILIIGQVQSVDYYEKPLQSNKNGFYVKLMAGEDILGTAQVYNGRYVLEVPIEDLLSRLPEILTLEIDSDVKYFSSTRDSRIQLDLFDRSLRWMSPGSIAVFTPSIITVQPVRERVRVSVYDENMIPNSNVSINIQDVQTRTGHDGVVEIEGLIAGNYQLLAGLVRKNIDIASGMGTKKVQVILPSDSQILSVPDEAVNIFSELTEALVELEEDMMAGKIVSLPDVQETYTLLIQHARDESARLSSSWRQYTDIRKRNLHLALEGQDKGTIQELEAELNEELSRLQGQWFAGQDEFLQTADEVLQAYLMYRSKMMESFLDIEDEYNTTVDRVNSLNVAISSGVYEVLSSIANLQTNVLDIMNIEGMERESLREVAHHVQVLIGEIVDRASLVKEDENKLQQSLHELKNLGMQYESLHRLVFGEFPDREGLIHYYKSKNTLIKGRALDNSGYANLLEAFETETLEYITEVIEFNENIYELIGNVKEFLHELPSLEELAEIDRQLVVLLMQKEDVFSKIEHNDLELNLKSIIDLLGLIEKVENITTEYESIFGSSNHIYGRLLDDFSLCRELIEQDRYIFDDIWENWEDLEKSVEPVISKVDSLRQELFEIEKDVLSIVDEWVEKRDEAYSLYSDANEFIDDLHEAFGYIMEISEDPQRYAEDDEYEEFEKWYNGYVALYENYWTGWKRTPAIEDAWSDFQDKLKGSGIIEAREALLEKRAILEQLTPFHLVFETSKHVGIDLVNGKAVEAAHEDAIDITIISFDKPRAVATYRIKNLGKGPLTPDISIPTSGYSFALFLEVGNLYAVETSEGKYALIRVDEIESVTRTVVEGRIIRHQHTIKLSCLYPMP